jgi:hypothetical protein
MRFLAVVLALPIQLVLVAGVGIIETQQQDTRAYGLARDERWFVRNAECEYLFPLSGVMAFDDLLNRNTKKFTQEQVECASENEFSLSPIQPYNGKHRVSKLADRRVLIECFDSRFFRFDSSKIGEFIFRPDTASLLDIKELGYPNKLKKEGREVANDTSGNRAFVYLKSGANELCARIKAGKSDFENKIKESN